MQSNFSTSGFTPTGIGGSYSKSSSASKETLLTTVTGGRVDINTAENTTLKGATIASVDEEGRDNGQLTLNTNTLNVSSLNNTSNSKRLSMGASIGGSYADNNLDNFSMDFSKDSVNSKTKTLSSIGEGTIQIADQENSDTTMLNRDIANNEVDIYDIQSHKGLSVELDMRLLSEDGRNEIAEDAKRTGKEMQKLDGMLPSGTNDNAVLAAAGKTLNFLNTVSLGIIPSDDSDGGLIGQVPVLFGQDDVNHKIKGDKGSENIYMPGIMNNEESAKNSADNIIGVGVKRQVWINPTHGFIPDLLESAVDKFGGQTGISKQAQEFLQNNRGLNIYMHSQAHLIAEEGAKISKNNGHTYYSFGAPMSKDTVKSVFNIKQEDNVQQNDGDYVSYPLNIFNPITWDKPGHDTENYGAAKFKKEREGINE